MEGRNAQIIHASVVNIVGNLLLALFKGGVGFAAHSIAIVLDAVNSLSDALSSIVTIVGVKLAERPANHRHPFGYGRIEYIASIVVAAIVIAAGGSSLIESIQTIIEPKVQSYGVRSLSILAVSCLGKLGLGWYLHRAGKRLSSGSLEGSASDAIMDAVVSFSTIVAALLYMYAGADVGPWLAAAIAILILKSGFELLIETVSKVLGERIDPQVAAEIERTVRSVPGVRLANGLVLQDFGPGNIHGSVILTVDGNASVADFDGIAREVSRRVLDEHKVQLEAIGAYPANSRDPQTAELRAAVGRIVWDQEHIVDLRGLYVDKERQVVRFDAVADFSVSDLTALREGIVARCLEVYPAWSFEAGVIHELGD